MSDPEASFNKIGWQPSAGTYSIQIGNIQCRISQKIHSKPANLLVESTFYNIEKITPVSLAKSHT